MQIRIQNTEFSEQKVLSAKTIEIFFATENFVFFTFFLGDFVVFTAYDLHFYEAAQKICHCVQVCKDVCSRYSQLTT